MVFERSRAWCCVAKSTPSFGKVMETLTSRPTTSAAAVNARAPSTPSASVEDTNATLEYCSKFRNTSTIPSAPMASDAVVRRKYGKDVPSLSAALRDEGEIIGVRVFAEICAAIEDAAEHPAPRIALTPAPSNASCEEQLRTGEHLICHAVGLIVDFTQCLEHTGPCRTCQGPWRPGHASTSYGFCAKHGQQHAQAHLSGWWQGSMRAPNGCPDQHRGRRAAHRNLSHEPCCLRREPKGTFPHPGRDALGRRLLEKPARQVFAGGNGSWSGGWGGRELGFA
eukprot:1166756-Prymnesium_polylepis.1